MNIGSAGMNSTVSSASARPVAPAAQVGPSQPVQASNGSADVSPEQVKQMVGEMQDQLDSMNIRLQYSVYGDRGNKIAIKVVDKGTGDVIREIPPKEIQSLQTKMSELVGMIFNGKG